MVKFRETTIKIQEWIVAICLLTITVVVFLQVVNRNLLSIPMPWTEEVAKIALLSLTYFGLAATFSRGYHIRVDLLDFILQKGKLAKVSNIIMQLLIGLFGLAVFYFGYKYFNSQLDSGQLTIALGIPLWLVIIPIMVSGILCVLDSILDVFGILKGSE